MVFINGFHGYVSCHGHIYQYRDQKETEKKLEKYKNLFHLTCFTTFS